MIHEMTNDYENNISATEYMVLTPCKGILLKIVLLDV